MDTSLSRLLGIDHPIIQAAIGSISCPPLAAAVSNAGGMGSIAMTGWGYDGTTQRLREAASLTDRGIIANVLLSYDVEAEVAAVLDEPPRRCRSSGATLAPTSTGSTTPARWSWPTSAASMKPNGRPKPAPTSWSPKGWEAGGHVRGTMATMALTPAVVDAIAPVPVIAAGGISDGRGVAAALCLGAQAAWIGTRILFRVAIESRRPPASPG